MTKRNFFSSKPLKTCNFHNAEKQVQENHRRNLKNDEILLNVVITN